MYTFLHVGYLLGVGAWVCLPHLPRERETACPSGQRWERVSLLLLCLLTFVSCAYVIYMYVCIYIYIFKQQCLNNSFFFVSHPIASHRGSGGTGHAVGMKHALIMDEVDGMAGNEDRGGVQVMKDCMFVMVLIITIIIIIIAIKACCWGGFKA